LDIYEERKQEKVDRLKLYKRTYGNSEDPTYWNKEEGKQFVKGK
jgi:hypothetical protein